MNRFRLQVFLKEFPFLKDLVNKGEEVDSIQVKRMDKNLFGIRPTYHGATGSLVGIDEGEIVHFLVKSQGITMGIRGELLEMLRDCVRNSGYVTHNEAYRDNESWDGETILEAIDRLDCAENLRIIILEEYGDNIRDHYSIGGLRFTIYKPAKGVSVKQLLVETKSKAQEEVQAESNF